MNQEEKISSRRFIVSGRVQGVFFRASTKKLADSLNLKGYAKNLQSGQVEVLVQGKSDALEELSEWLNQGPKLSKVESVVEVHSDTVKILTHFRTL